MYAATHISRVWNYNIFPGLNMRWDRLGGTFFTGPFAAGVFRRRIGYVQLRLFNDNFCFFLYNANICSMSVNIMDACSKQAQPNQGESAGE